MNSQKNDSLALVVGGLFILALVFATYNYFNKNKENQDNIQRNIEEVQKETASEENSGDINGNGASTEKKQETQEASSSKPETTASTASATVSDKVSTSTASAPVWTANDYKKGDIQGGKYTVKSGDTLWEIAEGVYGDGSQWVKILQANSNSVGNLPNGQQALIYAGQTLVLP